MYSEAEWRVCMDSECILRYGTTLAELRRGHYRTDTTIPREGGEGGYTSTGFYHHQRDFAHLPQLPVMPPPSSLILHPLDPLRHGTVAGYGLGAIDATISSVAAIIVSPQRILGRSRASNTGPNLLRGWKGGRKNGLGRSGSGSTGEHCGEQQ
jgi:hypothetical protein